eukprot:56315_1
MNNVAEAGDVKTEPVSLVSPQSINIDVEKQDIVLQLPNDSNGLSKSIFTRAVLFLVVILGGLLSFTLITPSNAYHAIAAYSIIFDASWILSLLFMILTSKNLHFFFATIGTTQSMPYMYIATGIKSYPEIAMTSLSSLFAVRGSSINISNTIGCCITFGVGFSAIFMKYNEMSNDNSIDINHYYALIVFLMGLFGVIGLILFPLEKGIFTQIIHYSS